MIVVTTPTGQIGSQVVKNLLAAGEQVRVIARNPGRLAEEVRDRVEVAEGSSDDEGLLGRALDGAESLFLVVPPSFTTNDVREQYLQFTRPVCRAMQTQNVRRIVAVSALGRGVPVDAGVVSDSFAKDEEIERAGLDFRALRCPGFMENMLRQVKTLREEGAFYLPARSDVKMPFASTGDIAAVGAKLLVDRAWSGQGGVAVLGPEDLSLNEVASILSEVLGKPIRYVQVPQDAYKAQLVQYGASEHMAQRLIAMYIAKDNGLDHAVPRTPENTTPTTFRQWCEEVLRPAVLAA